MFSFFYIFNEPIPLLILKIEKMIINQYHKANIGSFINDYKSTIYE